MPALLYMLDTLFSSGAQTVHLFVLRDLVFKNYHFLILKDKHHSGHS